MRFQTFLAAALPALILAAPTPQDPDYTFPEDTPVDDIVGGTSAASGEFPFIVSLQRGGSHFCGGSLLNANTVVTAAHCSVGYLISPISNLRVRAGSLNKGSGGVLVGVSSVTLHPNYRDTAQDYDIAIWKLSTSIPTSSTISYARLPSANSDPASGSTSTVAGWGALRSGSNSGPTMLQKVSVPIVSRTTCRSSYGNSITNNMFCAGYTSGGRDSCQGDSGGPIVDTSKTLIGIVSWGNGCALPNYPGVYARVSTFLSFIGQYD
ncbi:trypsin-domain-containing protein [Decorospora gaudefroyi]|uniref:Trypsin-domain-containing protein n=1 Tax=Decorospora gaudefroyi TaxID=184978 RepID=A0A6A5KBR7_9PLEO|nr:trypsin-domain-containing protein [Decorospora gaudefroyi]